MWTELIGILINKASYGTLSLSPLQIQLLTDQSLCNFLNPCPKIIFLHLIN